MGFRDGIPTLLEEGGFNRSYLNAARKSKEWRSLKNEVIRMNHGGSIRDRLELWSRLTGVQIDWPIEPSVRTRRWLDGGYNGMLDPVNQTATEAAMNVLAGGGFVLEANRIRILPYTEAVKFWKEWWETGEK